MKRAIRLIFLAGLIAAGIAAGIAAAKSRRATKQWEEEVEERRAEADPESLAALGGGNGFERLGLDMEKLQEMETASYKPLVQYLTAIQVKRGEVGESLLFVRQRDLDAMAELADEEAEGLVQQFRELGILMSMN